MLKNMLVGGKQKFTRVKVSTMDADLNSINIEVDFFFNNYYNIFFYRRIGLVVNFLILFVV